MILMTALYILSLDAFMHNCTVEECFERLVT